jgi:ABC-type polysaccharide/polyol phosphate transport system ATPase subunit
MICGTLTPTTGSIRTNGRVAALLELGSGFNPEFTGRENVYLNASVLGLSNSEIEQNFEFIAAFADIGDFIDQPVKTYSSGMFVRLAFAIAVHVKPEILVVDEALSVGDIAFQNRCMQKIQTLKRTGTSILFVSHDLSTVQILCDRVLWIKQGAMQHDGNPRDVCQEYHAEMMNEKLPFAAAANDQLPQQATGIAHFTALRTLDRFNRPREIFTVGDCVNIAFELEALAPMSQSVFTVSIYRSDGDWSIGQTSAEKQVFWPAVDAGHRLRGQIRLDPICLAPANYRICFSAFSTDLQTCFAMTELTTEFSVRSSYQTWGKFVHPCEWIQDDPVASSVSKPN